MTGAINESFHLELVDDSAPTVQALPSTTKPTDGLCFTRGPGGVLELVYVQGDGAFYVRPDKTCRPVDGIQEFFGPIPKPQIANESLKQGDPP